MPAPFGYNEMMFRYCLTVKVALLMVMVPVRDAPPLAETV